MIPAEHPSPRFRKVQSFETDYAPCTVSQYVSERSGMQVIVADRKGPKVNGFFTLATEIFDDSGAPHTLEHLVFMGSKNYRYKGLLDKLSSRAYSSTNAWTATDHTAYTLESAGWEGFAQILPVYLEHIIVPVITDEACQTEVHHIDGEGNDAGVVYSEMQAIQYKSAEIIDLAAKRLLYPENVGFRYETGGMTEALRNLTTQRIREFHREMYQPRNLCVVIVGEADHENLLEILDEFEESIKDDLPPLDAPFKRPWIDSVQPPPLNETKVTTVEFPEADESVGEVVVGWFGPDCTDQVEISALSVLQTYLCGSSVSILENVLVEKEELASSVMYWWESRPNSVIWFQPTSVATDKLEFVYHRLISLLQEVAEKPLDMEYMRSCIKRGLRQVKFEAESSDSFFSNNIIMDYLFGTRNGSTLADLKTVSEYEELETWTEEQWRAFLKKGISDAPHVAVLAKPSMSLAVKLKEEEEARLAKRKEELGEEGLAKLAEKLELAKKKNDQPIPPEVVDRWAVPGTESIHFIESETARSGKARTLGIPDNKAQRVIDAAAAEGARNSLFIQFESVPSNFVHLSLYLGTGKVPIEVKPLLPIFRDNFFNTPIMRGGKKVDFEQVVMELEEDTIRYGLRSSKDMGDPDSILIEFQIEPEKYATIIEWTRTMMFDSVFDVQRLKAGVQKQLADIPELKRDGRSMASEVNMAIHLKKEAYSVTKRALVRAVYLRRVKKLLETDPDLVVSWFEQIRKSLFTFNNLRVLVIADVDKLAQPVAAWDVLSNALGRPSSLSSSSSGVDGEEDLLPIVKPHHHLTEEGRNPGSYGAVIVPMTTVDSSYSVSTSKGVISFEDPRIAAILVGVGYLEAVEGPLWCAVRGQGMAYGVFFGRDINSGMVQFRVYRSPDASRALAASRETVRKIAAGEEPIDRHLKEGAISQIVVLFAEEQSTMAAAASQNFVLGVVRGVPLDWHKKIMKSVRDVTDEQIREVLNELVLPVFEPGKSNVVVTCAPILQENIEKALKETGYKTQVRQLADFHDDYGLKAPEGEEDEEEEDEEEGSEDEYTGSDSDSD
ncbi:cytoplasm protein [Sodiomyces alkalinus F11]|uniref:Cytoplasm protein n=1 Tax=Sodiomyces alkalinus (strain CBS 110278 / VKM F-3762 / F11) TaxID=1314773 RepID=A0A3N2QAC3_SODAK|nr:cytoplasm protein [Sodiomyces alkalinus F11]ROT43702.1 cytoplasm protein [Sodiomyces alkalinus F11]